MKRPKYIHVPLTPNQVQILYTEMASAASNCSDPKLGREYQRLTRKFNKHRLVR